MQSTFNLTRNTAYVILATGFLVACDSATGGNAASGIASLGSDFVRAFNQNPNDEPISLENVNLVLTPKIEPFNP